MSLKFEKTHEEFKDLLFASGILGKWVNMVSKFRFRWDEGGSFDWWPKNGLIMFETTSAENDRLKLLLFKILFNVAEIKKTPFLQLKTKIFVVCGENGIAQDQLEQVLDELHLGSNFLTSNNEEGVFIADALNAQKVRKDDKVFGIVLLTADYSGVRQGNDLNQVRPLYGPGLMLETGLLISMMNADHMVVLAKQGMILPTKIRGVKYLNYENNIQEVKSALIQHMNKAGLNLTSKQTPPASSPEKTKKPVVAQKPAEGEKPVVAQKPAQVKSAPKAKIPPPTFL